MKLSRRTQWLTSALLGTACFLTTPTAWAVKEVWLRAQAFPKTMPDGQVIQMWGFAQDTATTQNGVLMAPGPKIEVPINETTLTIHLRNNLPEPVSIVIPGQMPTLAGNPQRLTSGGRARSFTHEANALGGTADYTWTNLKPGTYLYYSGTHSAVQVQMGLYGAMTKNAGTLRAYPATSTSPAVDYFKELTLVLSEIDPVLHTAVAQGNYGPEEGKTMHSTLHYKPKYFLINGEPYDPAKPGEPFSLCGVTGQNNLLRLLNAGIDYHVPVLNGLEFQTVAEDGNKYSYPQYRSSLFLPALKTMDAVFNASKAGAYPFYDRRLGLVNATQSPGGMLAYLGIGKTFSGSSGTIPNSPGQLSRSIVVSEMPEKVAKVTVTLGLTHQRYGDLDVLLVGPSGKSVLLMSDAGGNTLSAPRSTTLIFDDAASQSLNSVTILAGTYKPTNLTPNPDAFNAPAPAGSPAGVYSTTLSVFNGEPANGTWTLYFKDDTTGGTGTVTSVNLTITPLY